MYWHKRPLDEYNPKKRLGLVHVYTGEGKGKTSAALGIALRAAGHNMKVLVVQFVKGHKDYGEILAQDQLKNIEVVQFGTPDATNMHEPADMDQYLANEAMDFTRKAMSMNRPDILVLDEINTVLHHGMLNMKDVLDFLDNRHRETEVILTGRDAPTALLNAADLVTVMKNVKSPYNDDFAPRKGVEH